jgi:C1A family cysteine protease
MFWQAGGDFKDGFNSQTYMENFIHSQYHIPFVSSWTYNPSSNRKTIKGIYSKSCMGYSEYCSDTAHQGKLVCTQESSTVFKCGFLTQIKDFTIGVRITQFEQLWNFQNRDRAIQLASTYVSAGLPLVMEFEVTPAFLSMNQGFTQPPGPDPESILGGHAGTIVGYLTHSQLMELGSVSESVKSGGEDYFIFKNSWGTSWGDSGYGMMPISYFKKHGLALLAVKDVEMTEAPSEPVTSR